MNAIFTRLDDESILDYVAGDGPEFTGIALHEILAKECPFLPVFLNRVKDMFGWSAYLGAHFAFGLIYTASKKDSEVMGVFYLEAVCAFNSRSWIEAECHRLCHEPYGYGRKTQAVLRERTKVLCKYLQRNVEAVPFTERTNYAIGMTIFLALLDAASGEQ